MKKRYIIRRLMIDIRKVTPVFIVKGNKYRKLFNDAGSYRMMKHNLDAVRISRDKTRKELMKKTNHIKRLNIKIKGMEKTIEDIKKDNLVNWKTITKKKR